MSREHAEGICEHCGRTFGYRLTHAGFADALYGYCTRGGRTAILDGWTMQRRLGIESFEAGSLPAGAEAKLRPCF